MSATRRTKSTVHYHLDDDGRFVIESYNQAEPFSNFFPGVAGVWGIPMWVFYVNRGQAVTSFGIESKDKAILEFQPANKAYRLTSQQGFRTFIKVHHGGKMLFWEPFQPMGAAMGAQVEQRMLITAHDLTLEEVQKDLGLRTMVRYFTVPGESFPALTRELTIENISRRDYRLEVIDGLPCITPFGVKDWLNKNLSRTVEAWMKVRNLDKQAPFFQLNVEVSDTPDVHYIEEGYFYFAFRPESRSAAKLLPAMADASAVFGPRSGFSQPEAFLSSKQFRVPQIQQTSNRTPCAMNYDRFSLAGGKVYRQASLAGHAERISEVPRIVRAVTVPGYLKAKADENKREIVTLQQNAFTNSSSPEFDQYCGQTFLDNVLRGGMPVSLQTKEGAVAVNVFSRKHGDLERDYNFFMLAPTYFSQGNGNYRDVNQNRRNDIWFNSAVGDSSIINFLSLVQADGYNPLVVKGLSFFIADEKKARELVSKCVTGDTAQLLERLAQGFQPGELLQLVRRFSLTLKVSEEEFLSRALSLGYKQELADHGEGFWSDHWTYNLDLIESYLSRYPEKLRELLIEKKVFHYFHNDHYILPRQQRYVLTKNGVRQYHNVKHDRSIDVHDHRLRSGHGGGEVYQTDLLEKLLCLVVNKAATLDPSGMGVEMEGGRPNWYDALNGLPGLLGSSISETLELRRLARFVAESLGAVAAEDEKFVVFSELAEFIRELYHILEAESDPLGYWSAANLAKEAYREKIRRGIDGQQHALGFTEIKDFLRLVEDRVARGIEAARDDRGIVQTYFYHDVTEYDVLDKKDGEYPYVRPLAFVRKTLPLFLEGPVHALRTERDPEAALALFKAVRQSPLFDKALKMYRVNTDLRVMTEEIGRTRVFPRGWLENESVWLHMEYKYLLEVLRSGLPAEFHQTIRENLVPFQDPKVYGRSTLENSSFIVSSSHEDPTLHGQGFIARLSGSTAEFIHIWLLMNMGPRPFAVSEDGELTFRLQPALAGSLFTSRATTRDILDAEGQMATVEFPAKTYAFHLAGRILTVYHNAKRADTYGPRTCRVVRYRLTYPGQPEPVEVAGESVGMPYAQDIRDEKVVRIDVDLE